MTYEPAPGMPDERHPGHAAPARKPQSVGLAEKLMYAGGVLTLLSTIWTAFGDRDALREQMRTQLESAGQPVDAGSIDTAMQLGVIFGITFGVISAAVWFLMGWLNGRGIGWARIVATILGVLGVLSTVFALLGTGLLPGTAAASTISLVLSIVTGLIALAVVVLLWRPDAKEFFAAHRRR